MLDMALCKETVYSCCSSAMIPKSSLCLSLCSVCLSWLLNPFWLKMWLVFFVSRCRALLTCIKSILHANLSSIQVALPISVLCLSYWLLLLMLTHFTFLFLDFFIFCTVPLEIPTSGWLNEWVIKRIFILTSFSINMVQLYLSLYDFACLMNICSPRLISMYSPSIAELSSLIYVSRQDRKHLYHPALSAYGQKFWRFSEHGTITTF